MYFSFVRRHWLFFTAVVIVYLLLSFGRAMTSIPWNDEAWYTTPTRSLLLHGNTGTPLLETSHMFWRGINQRTYWVVPLQFFVQLPWMFLFGFSLLKMRAFAICWGLVGMFAWGYTAWRLTANQWIAAVTILLLACDYQYDSQMSLIRMDAMALGCASLAFALYLRLRERHLPWAIFWSQLFVAACGLTHPTPGVPAFTGLLFLTLYLDRRRLRIVHALYALVPYLLGIAFWGWYILPAPDLFRAQFLGNVVDMDRLGGLKHPVRAIGRELGRYWGMAGFAPGMNPLYRIRIVVIFLYVAAVAFIFANRELRRTKGVSTLLGLWLTYFLTYIIYEGTKEVKYALHIIPIYDVLLAVAVVWLWQSGGARRIGGALAAAAFLAVSIGGLIYSGPIKDDYHREFQPIAQYLRTHAQPNDLILAGSEFGFELGFDSNIVDDEALTFFSHKQPKYIVMSGAYRHVFANNGQLFPEVSRYVGNMLANDYHRVYGTDNYEIFARNS